MAIGLLLELESIFGNKGETFETLIKNIPSFSMLKLLAYINAQIHIKETNTDKHKELISWLSQNFEHNEKIKITSFLSGCGSKQVPIFLANNQTILIFFTRILQNYNSIECENLSPKQKLDFFKALLLVNQEVNDKQNYSISDDNFKDEGIIQLFLKNQISQIEFIKEKLFYIPLVKCYHLFDFVETDEIFSKLLPYFLSNKGVSNWKEYARILLGIYIASFQTAIIKIGSEYTIERNLLHNLCINPENISNYDSFQIEDFTPFREKPIFKKNKNEYLVLSFIFLIDKLFKSIFFDFKEVAENLFKQDNPSFDAIFLEKFKKIKEKKQIFGILNTYFTTKFSEELLLVKAMKHTFSHKSINHKNSILTPNPTYKIGKDTKELTDFYVRKDQKICLFELKDVIMKAEIKHSYDYDKIKEGILDKFSNQKDKKGVPQLVNAINYINNLDFSFENSKLSKRIKAKKIIIYPILVFTDLSFSAFGVEEILQNEMNNQLGSYENIKEIKPLIMLDLNTLIQYENLFSKKNFFEIIEEYYDFKKKRAKDRKKSTKNFFNSFESFSAFLEYYVKRNNIGMDIPKILKDNKLDLV
ncbi:MAG: hypothetical protein EAZ85_13350 [Bacteroidetes bacterium]|nr:MAG: hypothetical protein EAZ85_13350 [Bacteroidota bacterium]TAG92089.1 MAG: hypothetical protein EAZ20_02810 [Bacteroidota bacterium]